jgi:hypothetical protein
VFSGVGSAVNTAPTQHLALFIQDTWNVAPNVADIGLRWDKQFNIQRTADSDPRFPADPPSRGDSNNFAPASALPGTSAERVSISGRGRAP